MGRTKLHFDGPVQQRLPGHQPTHGNHRLFSDYYLNDLLPKQPEWEDAEGLGEAFAAIESLFRKWWKGHEEDAKTG